MNIVKKNVIILTGVVAIIVAALLFRNLNRKEEPQIVEKTPINTATSSAKIEDEALKNALNLYIEKRADGIDFSSGPCLGVVMDDWVLDIAHRPRTAIDDLPENQCADFREGRAHHFIELDSDGQLIRSY